MKPNEPLIQNLQVWRVSPPPDSRFRGEVWRRIDALRGAGSWAGFVRAHAAGLAAAVVLTAGLSGWIGHPGTHTIGIPALVFQSQPR